MWPFNQISDLMSRLTKSRIPYLVVDDLGFSLCKSGNELERYAWNEVEKIVAFKRDYFTYDKICLQIDIGNRVGPLELNEEFAGYKQFSEAIEKYLPSVCQGWWSKVAFPAFAENATLVFLRDEGKALSG